MILMQDLLNRIRWGEELGQAYFEIVCCDRVEKKLPRVPLERASPCEGHVCARCAGVAY